MANLKDAIEGWLEVANSTHLLEAHDQIIEIAVRDISLVKNYERNIF
jgi:predicted RNase H-like HicB family nuclease